MIEADVLAVERDANKHPIWDSNGYPKVIPGKSRCSLCYGQMNEPPGARLRVALSALTQCEHLRDQSGKDVLAVCRQHLPLHPGRIRGLGPARPPAPPAVGYQPTLATEMWPAAGSQHHLDPPGRSITSIQAVLRPGRIDEHRTRRARQHLRPPRRHHQPLAARPSPRRRSTPRWTRWPRPAGSLQPHLVGERHYEQSPARCRRSSRALQGPAGHHRHPRRG